ncbi:hypothetical protein HDU76_008290 [Blyttiomyces sp. JEL0837]|nr:hypothetical protein HDU76_008290 [Blyttiomyces sp. JEL0837]
MTMDILSKYDSELQNIDPLLLLDFMEADPEPKFKTFEFKANLEALWTRNPFSRTGFHRYIYFGGSKNAKVTFDLLPQPTYGTGLLLTCWRNDLFDDDREHFKDQQEHHDDGDILWNTPLLHALTGRVNDKMIDVAQRFLGRGANVNHINRIGNSILHEVLRLGSSRLYNVLHFLLHYGADPTLRDVDNRTPMDIVHSHPVYSKDPFIINIFVDHMYRFQNNVNNKRFVAPNPVTLDQHQQETRCVRCSVMHTACCTRCISESKKGWSHSITCDLFLMGIAVKNGTSGDCAAVESEIQKVQQFRVGKSLAYIDDAPLLG